MATVRPPVRVAVLGAGSIAQIVHLPILTRMRGVQVAAIADRDAHTARTIAKRFEVPTVTTSFEEVLTDDVDAVVVCTPSNRHEDHVRAALRAGKHVLCEKPLALTPEGVASLLEEPGAEDRLVVAMNQRYRPDAVALRQFVSGGELGDVYYLRTGWLNRYRPRGRTWRERKATAGGGALMDLGLQMLDLALWTLGYPVPERVSAHMYQRPGSEVEEAAMLVVGLEGNRVVNLECTWSLLAQRDRQYLNLMGSGGSGSLSPLAVFKDMPAGLVDVTPQVPATRENLFTASYRNELAQFVEAVRGDRVVQSPREHLVLMRLVEAAYRSAQERREIVL
ncbi:Gfo/Idh/MocA family oxidoreductase [Longimicrobium sp.]|uniref:Gfo/Idh/MocA family protein n=1 Tax=Longimicrobium sp. TaxID=2029185 RepID=UPI002E32E59E|nr:Gfo/Idh/MocA family oxidoreductase [Longimicrobium sp.]HEX6041518.1 Gfo/Idh/MocA family oxidoreductase [Longimicrobium sp.]